MEFFVHISTLSAPERARTYADAPEDLPIPISPTIISELSPLGPVKDAIVTSGIVGAPVPVDSNTAWTLTMSALSSETSLSCTLLPYTLLDVRPLSIPSSLVSSDPVTKIVCDLDKIFDLDVIFDFCLVTCTSTLEL